MNTLLEIIRALAFPAYAVFLTLAALGGLAAGEFASRALDRAGFFNSLARGILRLREYLANQEDSSRRGDSLPTASL